MGREGGFWRRLADDASLSAGALPGYPIVELVGDRRVLIEHHFGVKEYGRERITVKVGYGHVCITGACLEILKMTGEQLVIRGKICAVTLQRRGNP